MYCTSNEFLKRMQSYIQEIERKSGGALTFEEYIVMPYYGHAILRFNLNKEIATLDELDAYEAFMQDIVNDDFLVDFMGSVYQKVGFESWIYAEKFKRCYSKYNDLPILPTDYQSMLKADAISLLHQCGLPNDLKVWEIQIEEDIALFVLGQENIKIGTYASENNKIHVYEVDEVPCIGLMRAIMHAKSQRISLVRVLLEA